MWVLLKCFVFKCCGFLDIWRFVKMHIFLVEMLKTYFALIGKKLAKKRKYICSAIVALSRLSLNQICKIQNQAKLRKTLFVSAIWCFLYVFLGLILNLKLIKKIYYKCKCWGVPEKHLKHSKLIWNTLFNFLVQPVLTRQTSKKHDAKVKSHTKNSQCQKLVIEEPPDLQHTSIRPFPFNFWFLHLAAQTASLETNISRAWCKSWKSRKNIYFNSNWENNTFFTFSF